MGNYLTGLGCSEIGRLATKWLWKFAIACSVVGHAGDRLFKAARACRARSHAKLAIPRRERLGAVACRAERDGKGMSRLFPPNVSRGLWVPC